MKQLIVILALTVLGAVDAFAQIDKEKLALAIANADAANMEKLEDYIWKRKSEVSMEGEVKLTTITEFSFDEQGELQTQLVNAESNVKKKPGIRGKVQEGAAEDKLDYVEKALELAVAYTFMTKGQLLDFFEKAAVTEKNGLIEATAENVYVKGDKLTLWVDGKTNLFIRKQFTSKLGEDPIDGELNFEPFSSGIYHGTTTVLNLPAQKMKINSVNQNYTQRVK